MTEAMSLTQPLVRGGFNARRQFDLSNPQLTGSLLVIVALGVIAGLVLFGKILSEDIADSDRARLNDAAHVSAARLDVLLLRAERDMETISRDLAALGEEPTALEIRTARRDAADLLDAGPLAGLIVLDDNNDVLMELTTVAGLTDTLSTQQPLESTANLLSDRLWMVASRTPNTPLLHLTPDTDTGRRMMAILDPERLADAVIAPASNRDAVIDTYLLDQENRVLFSTSAALDAERLPTPAAPHNLTPVEEVAVTRVRDRSGADRLLATAHLGDEQVRIVHAGAVQGGSAVFGRAATLTLALVAPSIIGIILLISVIQNEWRKSDRRANSASDAVARAEVASDILQAGIVDWSTRDASVVYTRGWRDLFGYADSVTGEQVFDWITRIHPDDRPQARRRYQKLMDGDALQIDHRIQVLCADGSYTLVRERAATRLDEAGDVVRVILVQTPFVQERERDAAA